MLIGGFYSVDGALLAKPPVHTDFALRLDAGTGAVDAQAAGQENGEAAGECAGKYTRRIYTNNGRTASVYALSHCAEKMQGKKVLLPDYLCLSVISAIEWAGLSYDFYRVSRTLEIDMEDLESKLDDTVGMIYVIHYFSVPQPASVVKQLCQLAKTNHLLIMEDITQALFSRTPADADFCRMGFGDYIVGSTRKWFPMTDGGICAIRNDGFHGMFADIPAGVPAGKPGDSANCNALPPLPPLADAYDESVYKELLISVMRPLYAENPELEKEAYLAYEKEANASRYIDLTPRKMTEASKQIFFDTDTAALIGRRIENFRYLYGRLSEIPEITVLSKDIGPYDDYVPFGLVILAEDRNGLYHHLVQHNIIPEIQWILPTEYYTPGEDAQYLSDHNLMLQCDQRYGISEMKQVADVIEDYFRHK